METSDQLITSEYYKTSYEKEDVSNLPQFKKWKKERENEGQKIVKCPNCWGYEIFVEPTNHICTMCEKEYCQYCLQKCVEDEVQHDHERGCCSKFCSLVNLMINEGKYGGSKPDCAKLLRISLIFLFGNPMMFTYRYFKFFQKNKIRDNKCVHFLFTYLNLFANILTACSIMYITWLEFFMFLFFPSFIPCYFHFIINNWDYLIYELEIDETPLLELTVSGKGYMLY